MQLNKKFGSAFIAAALLLWVILTPSPFQKGGVDFVFYFAMAAFVAAISFLFTFLFHNCHLPERILVSLLFAVISLFLMTLVIGPRIVELIYNDKTWVISETIHRIFINAVYYGLNAIILIVLNSIYFTAREKLKSRKELESKLL